MYVHRYSGRERTERSHSHPWLLAFGVLFKGWLIETVGAEPCASCRRGALSLRVYGRSTLHRIEGGDALTLFVGFVRTQKRIKQAAEVPTSEGYCHYTEIMPDEEGFRAGVVAHGSGMTGRNRE